jgi:membrane-associated phospholipid phosphatase
MENILSWGINLIFWLQRFSPRLDLFFRALTSLGDEGFYLVFLAFFYWCLDRRTGARLSILFLLSIYVGVVAKVLANQPRPFQFDPRIRQLVEVSGRGFPSIHTLNAVILRGYLASQFRRFWLWVIAVVLMVLIPISRLYLGVHFPIDLLGGYFIGAVLLSLYLGLGLRYEAWLVKKRLTWQLCIALAVPGLLMLLFPSGEGVTVGALLTGVSVGFVLENQWVHFDSGGIWWVRLLRLLLGVAVLWVMRLALKAAFFGLDSVLAFRFLRYVLIGLWSGMAAPWVFVRLRLAAIRGAVGQPLECPRTRP